MDFTDAQWARLSPRLPTLRTRPDGRGRPWRDPRDVLNGILWVKRTGAPWKYLPDRYPVSNVSPALSAGLGAACSLGFSTTWRASSPPPAGTTFPRPSSMRP